MCRLFGLSSAPTRTHATFWLLDTPDSLSQQSHGNRDGTGLGTFSVEGIPRLDRQPLPAFADDRFAREAQHRESTTFLAHIRHASTGALKIRNTHPFEQSGRFFAHNGSSGGFRRWRTNWASTATSWPVTPTPNGSRIDHQADRRSRR
jgi:glutamine amidotransferase